MLDSRNSESDLMQRWEGGACRTFVCRV